MLTELESKTGINDYLWSHWYLLHSVNINHILIYKEMVDAGEPETLT